jgi:hypothetical protein
MTTAAAATAAATTTTTTTNNTPTNKQLFYMNVFDRFQIPAASFFRAGKLLHSTALLFHQQTRFLSHKHRFM